jgi:hypothetical protein
MSDQMIVIGTFAISYGAIIGYAVYLYRRRHRTER